jgi:hypothetical protein
MAAMFTIKRDGSRQTGAEIDSRLPAQHRPNPAIIGVVVTNIDRFAVWRVGNDLKISPAGNLNREHCQIAQVNYFKTT